ncbi:MAG: LutB/LldF family L-lactate oxidation iron-sulfur protein [Alphaproteobacteria bacterium]
MEPTSSHFPDNAARAIADPVLRAALNKLESEFHRDRAAMQARLPEFDALRDQARAIKDHALDHLADLLESFEAGMADAGGKVHWCRDAAAARQTILKICQDAGARNVVKSKSMLSEEIALNDHLAANGIEPVETDLGEYILQLRGEAPSHVVMPAIHLNAGQIADAFREHHTDRDPGRDLDDKDALLAEAREILRQRFLDADVGITGANFLIAESGSIALVTNEGNADLVHSLPPVHIALASIEKVVPTVDDALALIRVLARSATTQEITSYTSFVTGPAREGDVDGPSAFHVVLLDNGRTKLLGGPYRDILRCIRCGACQSQCPVYGTIGGHAYGWVYGGPIGAILTPGLLGPGAAHHLPHASSLCGRCEEVCPVRIPLPALLRRLREDGFADATVPAAGRRWVRLWARIARRPRLYRLLARVGIDLLTLLSGRRGRLPRLPFIAAWTRARDLPSPEGGTFIDQWKIREAGRR